jgi:hypothetical protein
MVQDRDFELHKNTNTSSDRGRVTEKSKSTKYRNQSRYLSAVKVSFHAFFLFYLSLTHGKIILKGLLKCLYNAFFKDKVLMLYTVLFCI